MLEFVTKEILNEVVDGEVDQILYGNTSLNPNKDAVVYTLVQPRKSTTVRARAINIHVLASMCKEKSTEYEYFIQTGNRLDGTHRYDVLSAHRDTDFGDYLDEEVYSKIFDTEYEATISAFQWLLKKEKGLNNG